MLRFNNNTLDISRTKENKSEKKEQMTAAN